MNAFRTCSAGKKLLEAKARREQSEATTRSRETYRELLSFIGDEDARKFEELRRRCAALTALQNRMSGKESPDGSSRFRAESLDKLLWLYLKLLHQKAGITRFLRSTDREVLVEKQDRSQRDLESAREAGRSERLVNSIQEKLTTIGERIRNYDETSENWEIVVAEIEKTEQKIAHVCEVGMTSRDPSALARQIDGISDSVALSEETLGGMELDSFQSPAEDLAPTFVSDFDEFEEGDRGLVSE